MRRRGVRSTSAALRFSGALVGLLTTSSRFGLLDPRQPRLGDGQHILAADVVTDCAAAAECGRGFQTCQAGDGAIATRAGCRCRTDDAQRVDPGTAVSTLDLDFDELASRGHD